MREIKLRAPNIIFKIEVETNDQEFIKTSFHLDYENKLYRQAALIELIRDTVLHFALTKDELREINHETAIKYLKRAWSRISNRPYDKKGDYGELLLFLILEVFFPARKFVTKIRLRSSKGDEIKGYDCAHFTKENGKIILWLGEAKFHQSFSTAVSSAFESVREHLTLKPTKDEISILEGNVDLESPEKDEMENYLNSGISFDKMNFRIPVLITYDSKAVRDNEDTNSKFKNELIKEIEENYKKIEQEKIELRPNIEMLFILMPLYEVSEIKRKLKLIEETHK